MIKIIGFILGYVKLDKIFEPLRLLYWRKTLNNIGKGSSIGRDTEIIEPKSLSVGDNVYIGRRVSIYAGGNVTIGDNTLIANECTILTRNHNFEKEIPINKQGYTYKKVAIEDDVWLGNKVIILPGVTIGKGAIVAAGAVVSKNVEPFTIVGGVPAKKISNRYKS